MGRRRRLLVLCTISNYLEQEKKGQLSYYEHHSSARRRSQGIISEIVVSQLAPSTTRFPHHQTASLLWPNWTILPSSPSHLSLSSDKTIFGKNLIVQQKTGNNNKTKTLVCLKIKGINDRAKSRKNAQLMMYATSTIGFLDILYDHLGKKNLAYVTI